MTLNLLSMTHHIVFRRHPTEDPHKHLRDFINISITIEINGVTGDAIKLIFFHFLLIGSCEGLARHHTIDKHHHMG